MSGLGEGYKKPYSQQVGCIIKLALTKPHEFHRNETPLSSNETSSFNDPVKSAILLMWHPI